MHERDLLKTLRRTAVGLPDQTWVARQRDILISQISGQQDRAFDLISPAGARLTWDIAGLLLPRQAVARGIITVALVAAIALSSSITTAMAERSVSGDILYPVKITSEKVQMSLTKNPEAKARLGVSFAGKRVSEMQQITNTAEQHEKKFQKILSTLEGYKKSVVQATQRLSQMQQSASAQNVVAVATLMNDQVEDYSVTLSANKQAAVQPITEALAVSEQAVNQAVDIIVQKHQDGVVSNEVVQHIAEKKINTANEKVAKLSEQIGQAKAAVAGNPTTAAEAKTANQKLGAVEAKPSQAKEELAQAQQLLISDPASSLEKVKTARELTKEVQTALDEAQTAVGPAETITDPALVNAPEPEAVTPTETPSWWESIRRATLISGEGDGQ